MQLELEGKVAVVTGASRGIGLAAARALAAEGARVVAGARTNSVEQNSSVRRLAVPDLTTTVLTLTVTGIGADSALGGGGGSRSGRRLVSVAAMFLGALVGAVLILHVHVALPLVVATALVVAVALVGHASGRSDPAWTRVED